ncbi:hypothetical protein BUALT_Bualt13G0098400 [Buddleja alternifolia]|uniref:Cation/H+ exchanger domain-containing protein n=1 Tax=Buddleja alternifolia TaxID=168488 RepID=A0AAV6WUL5_9LAMI|nr:hypothetical protein BUALT_Bualt13G0098400 [Buddleja alternifolia]
MNGDSVPINASCYASQNRWSRGIFFADNPFTFSTPLLLIQLSLCALLTALLHRLFTPLGQSVFISQILAGVILGPSLLGSIKIFREFLFPVSSFYIVETFAFFGVMLYLFIIGVKTDLSLIRKSGKRAVAIGVCAFSMPLVLNFVLGLFLSHFVPMEPDLHESIPWIASFQATSSFHVIVCLLSDLKLMNSDLGRLAISSSMISGVCSWFWAIIVFTGKHGVNVKPKTLFLMILFLIIMVIITVCIFRPIILWMIKRTGNAKSVRESHICTIFIMILFSALYGEYFGQHFLFGPMILGMVIPDGPPLGSALVNKLEMFVSSIILPIYFVVSAANIDFSAISLRNLAIIEFLAAFALIWKVAGVMAPSLYCKMPITDALYLGLILSNQGIMEILVLERAKSIELLDSQSYSIMVLSIVVFTGIIAPIVKFLYKPSKKYTVGGLLTIQHANPNAELRILACLHYQEHTHSILHLFEASYPHPRAPISFYVVHLVDLAGRSAPVLMAHHPGPKNPLNSNESDHIINALRFFEYENRGNVIVYPFTAISPYVSMHNDVCSLAAEKRVSLVVVLFHKHPAIHVSEVEANAIRSVNQNIINKSPCSVGILIDRGAMNCTSSILSCANVYRIGVIFLGGPDDREALVYAARMAKHPNICLTLVRFVDDYTGKAKTNDTEQDLIVINRYTDAQMKNKRCFYQEESVKDSMGFLSVIRSMESFFDLILVGRRHDEDSPLLAGLQDWNEFPELGCVGDMLVSLDSLSEVSVLVVQQAMLGEEKMDYTENIRQVSSTVLLDIPRNDARVNPHHGLHEVSSSYVIMGGR